MVDKRKQFYDELKKDYENIPDFNKFSEVLNDPKRRRELYDELLPDYELPDYDTFSGMLAPDWKLPEHGAPYLAQVPYAPVDLATPIEPNLNAGDADFSNPATGEKGNIVVPFRAEEAAPEPTPFQKAILPNESVEETLDNAKQTSARVDRVAKSIEDATSDPAAKYQATLPQTNIGAKYELHPEKGAEQVPVENEGTDLWDRAIANAQSQLYYLRPEEQVNEELAKVDDELKNAMEDFSKTNAFGLSTLARSIRTNLDQPYMLGTDSFSDSPEVERLRAKRNALLRAKQYIEIAREINKNNDYEGFGNKWKSFFPNAATGIKFAVGNNMASLIPAFGADAAVGYRLHLARKQKDGKPLTSDEQEVMNAFALEDIMEGRYGEAQRNRGFIAGEGLVTMIEFMAELRMSPTSGLAKTSQSAAKKYLAKYVEETVKKYGKHALKSRMHRLGTYLLEQGARLGGALANSAATAVLLQGDDMFRGTADKYAGEAVAEFDGGGNVASSKFESGDSLSRAFYEKMTEQTIENFTEEMFAGLGLGKYLGHATTRASLRLGKGFTMKTMRLLNKVNSPAWVKGMQKAMESLKIGGIGEEVLEEYAAFPLQHLMGVSESGRSLWDEISDPETFYDIAAGLSLGMGGMGAVQAVGTVGSAAIKPIVARNIRKALERTDVEAAGLLGERWTAPDGFRTRIDFADEAEIGARLGEIVNECNTEEERKAVINYALAHNRSKGFNIMLDNMRLDNSEAAGALLLSLYENGYDGKVNLFEVEQRMESIEVQVPGIKEGVTDEFIRTLTPEQQSLVREYQDLQLQRQGILDRVADSTEARVSAMIDRVTARMHKPSGAMVTTNLLDEHGNVMQDAQGAPLSFYVIDGGQYQESTGRFYPYQGSIVLRDAEGNVQQVDAKRLVNAESTMTAGQLIAEQSKEIREKVRQSAIEDEKGKEELREATETQIGAQANETPEQTEQRDAVETSNEQVQEATIATLAAELEALGEQGMQAKEAVESYVSQEMSRDFVAGRLSIFSEDVVAKGIAYYDALTATPSEVGAAQAEAAGEAQVAGVEALIIRDKDNNLDIKAMREAGVTPEQMAEIFVMEYAGEVLKVASEYLDMANDALSKETDPAKRRGSRRADAQYWEGVTNALSPQVTVGVPLTEEEVQPTEEEETSVTEETQPIEEEETQPVAEEEETPETEPELTPVEKALKQIEGIKSWTERESNATTDEEKESFGVLAYSAINELKGMLKLLSEEELEEIRLQGSFDFGPIDEAIYREFERRGKAEGFKFPKSEPTPETEQEPTTEATESEQTEEEGQEEAKPKQKSITEQLFEVREEEFQAMLDRGNLDELREYHAKLVELLRETQEEVEARYAKLRMLNNILKEYGELRKAPKEVQDEYDRVVREFDYLYSRQEVRNRITRVDDTITKVKRAMEEAEKQRRAGLFNGYLRFDNSLEAKKKEDALNRRSRVDGKLRPTAEHIESLVTGADTKLVKNVDGHFVNGKKVNKAGYDYAVYLTERYRQVPLLRRINEWQEKVGVKIQVIEDFRELSPYKQRDIRATERINRLNPGWYNTTTGVVTIYLPHVSNESYVDETYTHEVVAHKGMRILMGEQWDALCDAVWESMSEENKRIYRNYAIHINGIPAGATQRVQRNAADEYMAHLSEKTDYTSEEQSIWDNIVEFVKQALTKLGVKFEVTEDMVKELLRASYRNLQEVNKVKDTFEQAKEIVDAQSAEETNTINSVKEENNSENSVEGEEKIVPLSQIKDFSYDTTRRLTTGVERGSIGVRCLGEEMERGRRGLPLCIAAIISRGNLGSNGQVGAMVPSESREKEQQEQRQAPRAEASVVGSIIKWAKDYGFYQTLSGVTQGAEINAANDNSEGEGIYTHPDGYSIRIATETSAEDILKYIEAITLYNRANPETKIEITGFGVAPKGSLLIFSRQNQTGVSPLNTSGLEVSAKDVEIIASEEALDRLMEEELPPTEEELIISEAKANGTYMLAPNGKKSKLSPEQWVMVRTKAFKKWFGDWEKITKNADGSWNIPKGVSHIIDANGEPLVVYHGSPNKWDVFDLEKFGSVTDDGYYGRGLYLSEDKDMAAVYGEPEAFFVNIKNPLRIGQAEELIKDMDEAIRRADLALLFNKENAPEELKKYDGVLFLALGPVFEEIVIPRANQIKSATDNIGTYGTETDNIHFRKGEGALTNEELSLANDPAAKLYGQSFRTKAQQKKFADNVRKQMAKKAQTLSEKLGLPVEVLESNEGLTGKKANAKGWYDVKSGKITIVLSNNESVADVEETILHEGVAHLGLRKLFGKQFTQFLDNVYNNAEQSIRDQIDRFAKKNNVSTRTATEEYLAHLAESTDFKRAQQSGWWQKIKSYFLKMLDSIGFEYKGKEIGDAELRYLLWRSYENLTDPTSRLNPFSQAREVAMEKQMQKEAKERKERERILALGTVDSNRFSGAAESSDMFKIAENIVTANQGDDELELEAEPVLFRSGTPIGDAMRAEYNAQVRSWRMLSKEAWRDHLASVELLLNVIAEKSGKAITDLQNVYYRMLDLPNINDRQINYYMNNIMPLLMSAVHDTIGEIKSWEDKRVVDLMRYVKMKHGIERNRDMAVREAMQEQAGKEYATAIEDAVKPLRDAISALEEELIETQNKLASLEAISKPDSATKVEIARLTDLIEELDKQIQEKASTITDISRFPKKHGLKTKEEIIQEKYDAWYEQIEEIRKEAGLTWREQQEKMDKLAKEKFGEGILALEKAGMGAILQETDIDLRALSAEDLKQMGLKSIDEAIMLGIANMTPQQQRVVAYDYLSTYEMQYTQDELNNLWQAISATNNWALEKQRESGLVNDAYVKDSRRRYQFYVPLRGFEKGTAEDLYDYLEEPKESVNPVRTAEGRESESNNPFTEMVKMGLNSITVGNRNLAMHSYWDLANRADVEGLLVANRAWYTRAYSEEDKTKIASAISGIATIEGDHILPSIPENATPKQVEYIMERFNTVLKELQDLGLASHRKSNVKPVPLYATAAQINAHTNVVYIDGEKCTVTIIGSPRVAQALRGELNYQPTNYASGVWKDTQRFMAGTMTSKNAAFSIANLVRDTQHAVTRVAITKDRKYLLKYLSELASRLNPLRWGDTLRMYNRYQQEMGVPTRFNQAKNWSSKLTNEERYQRFKEFMDLGGATGYTLSLDEDKRLDLLKELSKSKDGKVHLKGWNVVGGFFDMVSAVSESAELVNRFIAYEVAQALGKSKLQAIRDARDITLDFRRRGAGYKTVGTGKLTGHKGKDAAVRLIASLSQYGLDNHIFWNASIQGNYQLYEMFKEHKGKTVTAFIAQPAVGAFLMPYLASLMGGDDEDEYGGYYDELAPWERQNYLCFNMKWATGKSGWIKIPLPIGFNKFWACAESATAAMRGKGEFDVFHDCVENLVEAFIPVDVNWGDDSQEGFERMVGAAAGLAPSVTEPVLQAFANRDWLGRPIANKTEFNKYKPEYMRVSRRAGKASTAISKGMHLLGRAVDRGELDFTEDYVRNGSLFEWNPQMLEHFVTGYTSGYGSFGIASIDAGITYISEAIRTRDLVEAAKNTFAEMPTQKVPVVSRFYSTGDSGQQARLLRGRYYSEVDRFIKEMQSAESSHRQACEAAEKSGDPMEMAKAISEFKAFAESERYKLYLDWKEPAKEISKALKYFEAEDTPMLYRDAMQEMLDILND